MQPGVRQRWDVGAALEALKALLEDPDDTAQVFRIIRAMSGATPERGVRRMRRTRSGRRLLRARPNLLATLVDREALARMPDGSLAHAYLAFVKEESIAAEGLVQASLEGRGDLQGLPADIVYFGDRMRDTHDLWHVVTGYKGDLLGEASLLAFTFAQTRNPGIGLIVVMALLRGAAPHVRRLILGGLSRGLRAKWLPAQEWEALLPRPLEEVRRLLRVGPPADYAPFRSNEYQAARAA